MNSKPDKNETGITRYLRTLWHSRRLRSRDWRTRQAAVQALATIGGSRVVELLLLVLDDDTGFVVNCTVEALGNSGDSRVVEPLIDFLKRPERDLYFSHVAAIRALGKLGDSRAINVLKGMLRSDHGVVRRAAALSLANLGESQWATWFLGEHEDFRRLGSSVDPLAFDILVSTLQNGAGAQHRAPAVVGLLKCGGARAYDHLVTALWDLDTKVRVAATESLGELGDRRAIEPLIEVLCGDCREKAATSLAKLGQPHWASWIRGEPSDFDRLAASGNSNARLILLKTLDPGMHLEGSKRSPCRLTPLSSADKNQIISIFKNQEAEWLPVLLDAFLQPTNDEAVLVDVLRSFNTPSAIEQMITYLSVLSQHPKLPCGLESRVSRNVLEYVRSEIPLKERKYLGPSLLQSLRDEDFSIRAQAARILSQKGDQRCSELLLNIVARPMLETKAAIRKYGNLYFAPDRDMVTIVVVALCSDSSPATRQCLERIIRHTRCQWHIEGVDEQVTQTLANIGMPESIGAICERLRAPDLLHHHIYDLHRGDAKWVMDETKKRVNTIVRHLSVLISCIREKNMLTREHYDHIS